MRVVTGSWWCRAGGTTRRQAGATTLMTAGASGGLRGSDGGSARGRLGAAQPPAPPYGNCRTASPDAADPAALSTHRVLPAFVCVGCCLAVEERCFRPSVPARCPRGAVTTLCTPPNLHDHGQGCEAHSRSRHGRDQLDQLGTPHPLPGRLRVRRGQHATGSDADVSPRNVGPAQKFLHCQSQLLPFASSGGCLLKQDDGF